MTASRWLLIVGAACSAGLFVYCSARQLPEPPTPKASGLPRLSRSAEGAGPAPSAEELEEARYRPLLAEPGFEEVVRALEDRDPVRAADAYAARMARAPEAPADRPRHAFLLGTLEERAGRPERALLAYERAREPDFALRGYAALGAARALTKLGRHDQAEARLSEVPAEPPLGTARALFAVEAALGAGDGARALSAFRALRESDHDPSERFRIALLVATSLLEHSSPDAGRPSEADALEALGLSRRVAAEAAADETLARSAEKLADRALSALPGDVRARYLEPTPKDELTRIQALLEARAFDQVLKAARELDPRLEPAARVELGCQLLIARGKAEAGKREWGRARASLDQASERCRNQPAEHARALYLAGKYAVSERSFMAGIRAFEALEREHPGNTLADDARLAQALAYEEIGVTARFTELISSLPDDYPNGDMAADGLFVLAMRRIERRDWSGAASVLTRARSIVGERDATRGAEVGGRERYFLARAELALGRRASAIEAFERVVVEVPLSYYMLQAHSRLSELDAERARRAREQALVEATKTAGPRAPSDLLERPPIARALELLRVGETAAAVRELERSGLVAPGVAPELLFAVARLYAKAGALKLGHDVLRSRLNDWRLRWPAAGWSEPWRLAYPRPYLELVEREAKKNELEPALVFAVMREESAFDPDAASTANAYGLMQLIVPTAQSAARGTGLPHDRRALLRPSVNVPLGCRTLARYRARFEKNPLLAIPAYNAGPNRVKRWLSERPSLDFDLWVEAIPYLETRRYTKRVLSSRAAYAFLYGDGAVEGALSLPSRPEP